MTESQFLIKENLSDAGRGLCLSVPHCELCIFVFFILDSPGKQPYAVNYEEKLSLPPTKTRQSFLDCCHSPRKASTASCDIKKGELPSVTTVNRGAFENVNPFKRIKAEDIILLLREL